MLLGLSNTQPAGQFWPAILFDVMCPTAEINFDRDLCSAVFKLLSIYGLDLEVAVPSFPTGLTAITSIKRDAND